MWEMDKSYDSFAQLVLSGVLFIKLTCVSLYPLSLLETVPPPPLLKCMLRR